ncbi:FGGY-family carbohydrate kinase [Burkholderia multivorans]|uniref:Xylulokinase n=1 Tax=Burkholderia multivorans TaxID=87883 RepID=A0A8E2S0M8_9BURK|nr:FGGY-family carbohydrate kinase [Burkholderia multivorans]MBU9365620.1 FGGY-family carbohydrate kinase [Burkholderia multivorans]MCA8261666.1 FGGY-family carbohydrate kinase [Burkholderia multivorans]MCL4627283.1 FGGY-family carbohydrate kinase [Burkholderia multivorans]MCO1357932.1 FGGY-family carbohydrate kinase [Burkholderia multivorans]MCO1384249.1 FGGY-family carbohydrate kinase [Burkholderia multivorans]
MEYVIGVDIGTQSTKALLVDRHGTIVAQRAAGYRPDTPKPLWAEQWPQVWFDAVLDCIAGCVDEARTRGVRADAIRAVCVSSLYGGSGIPVDRDMRPIHPCLIWMDRRATAEVERVNADVDVERLHAITGNGIDSYYGFTKMLWLREQRPEVWANVRYFLPPNAYAIYLLTGEIAVDHSSAGNIGGVYDIARREWSDEALDMLGIPATMMPERLVESTEIVGGLLSQWTERLGLRAGTPLVAGGVDAAVATFAAGATRAGQHVAMIGTSMCWGYVTQHADARHGLVSMPHVFDGQRDLYVFGGAITAGASVAWFRDQFCHAECEAARALPHGDPHVLLEEAAARVPAGADGVLFLPYLMGERSPVWDAKASGAFVGLSLAHTRAHLYRAVLEGVAFALRHNIDAGRRGAAMLDDKLIVVGGAAHSALWMQIVADVTGFPVWTIEQDVEAAMGAALLAAFGVGIVSHDDAQGGWVSLVERARPDPARAAAYAARFALYTALYPALKPIMHELQSAS